MCSERLSGGSYPWMTMDRQWCCGDGTMSNSVVLVRYADDMVLLARTESEARQARLQSQFAALRLVVNQEQSRLTTVAGGARFLVSGFGNPRDGCGTWGRARRRANISGIGCAK